MQVLLDNRLSLNHAGLRRSSLNNVLLDMVHDALVDRLVEDGLDLHNLILTDGLLDNWCPVI